MSKIKNPIVLIHKRENSDTYAVAITDGSQDYHDAVLMATMEPDMIGDDVDTWSKTGYYMAAEIESLRAKLEQAEAKHLHLQCLVDDFDWQRQRLHAAAEKVIKWCRQEAEHRTGDPNKAENYACVKELRDALTFCESSGGIEKKCLTITLPALPVLGSQEEWYQGFAAGAGSMREECTAALISAGIRVEMK
ncbi:hypothetical protein [Citrobacter freundii complex sp. CFNIH2]|uniref:hypothetical protein n=1 Tax=Citrobacter freundii complex sp. CFNIH2 TaxID=2066049 RepID=UPI0021CBD8B7|nr:hypothetical protein [Citrobacter freundii complex sp. CFNIH2]